MSDVSEMHNKNRNMGLFGPGYGSMAYATTQRNQHPTCVFVLRAVWWVSRSVVNRVDEMVVIGWSQWFRKSTADRFTTPYAQVRNVRAIFRLLGIS